MLIPRPYILLLVDIGTGNEELGDIEILVLKNQYLCIDIVNCCCCCCCLTDIHPVWGDNSALLPLFQVERQPHGDVNRKSGVERTQVALSTTEQQRTEPVTFAQVAVHSNTQEEPQLRHTSWCDPLHCCSYSRWPLSGSSQRDNVSLPRSDRLYPGWSWEWSSPSPSRPGTPPLRGPWLQRSPDSSPSYRLRRQHGELSRAGWWRGIRRCRQQRDVNTPTLRWVLLAAAPLPSVNDWR